MVKAEEHASGEGTQKVDLSDVKNSDIANAIDEYIHSERDRKILKRRLIDGPQIMHLVRGGRGKMDDVLRYVSFSIIQSEISKVRYTKKNLSKSVSFALKVMILLHWLSPYIFKNTRQYFGVMRSV